MPVETRSVVRQREAEERSFYMMSRLVAHIQRASCTHCREDFMKLMELYYAASKTATHHRFSESLILTDLYTLAKCAEYLGMWDVYDNIRCGEEHMFSILDVAQYDVWWRQICGELDITFVHSKR